MVLQKMVSKHDFFYDNKIESLTEKYFFIPNILFSYFNMDIGFL